MMHDPCSCCGSSVWDEEDFFLSCDDKVKQNIWMSKTKLISRERRRRGKIDWWKRREKKMSVMKTRSIHIIRVSAASNMQRGR
jgi:hypothetical protein